MELLLTAQAAVCRNYSSAELQALRQATIRAGTVTFWRGQDSQRLRGHISGSDIAALSQCALAGQWFAAALPQVPRTAVSGGEPLPPQRAKEQAPAEIAAFVVDGAKVFLLFLPQNWTDQLNCPQDA